MKIFNLSEEMFTQYIFFTGKGGVGKTSVASATAVGLADAGHKVLLVSTDPASNLQDVFSIPLDNKGIAVKEVPNLTVLNLDPEKAAQEYKESVVSPYRGKLPDSVIANMEEQLSGSCTVEIAAFNEFSDVITSQDKSKGYEYILFDTAPTGHTLRMLQLPSAWDTFIDENTTGTSCLGQLSGLEDRKEVYKQAVATLSDSNKTTIYFISRPDETPIKEVERSSKELKNLGIHAQRLIINGVLESHDIADSISKQLYQRQQSALQGIPESLKNLPTAYVPLRSYNMTGIANIRNMLKTDLPIEAKAITVNVDEFQQLDALIEDLYRTGKRVIFTMGKGGVGKTTIAAAIARGLAERGVKVHLSTTDPANHLGYVKTQVEGISVSHIDEKAVLETYKKNILEQARKTLGDADLSYIEEDLRSPCTQEIAIFNAFAEIVDKASNEVVVIDTAPTGHTLLLLDTTESYHHEVERTAGNTSPAVASLLPRLRNQNETEVVIITLPETTPVFEAQRLQKDLRRAGLKNKWWVVNASMLLTDTNNSFLKAKGQSEIQWIEKVKELSNGNFAIIPWKEVIE